MRVVFLVALCLACPAAGFTGKQVVKVKGQFFCPEKPEDATNIKVEMIEKDVGPDDHMGTVHTDGAGKFEVRGEETEISTILAQLNVYHNCNDKNRIIYGKPCMRKWEFKIPDKYINGETMDLGRMNLEIVMEEEEHHCRRD